MSLLLNMAKNAYIGLKMRYFENERFELTNAISRQNDLYFQADIPLICLWE